MTRGRGRPKGDNPKSCSLVVRVTPSFMDKVSEIAKDESDKSGTTVSNADLVRIALFRAFNLKEQI